MPALAGSEKISKALLEQRSFKILMVKHKTSIAFFAFTIVLSCINIAPPLQRAAYAQAPQERITFSPDIKDYSVPITAARKSRK